MDGLPVDRGSRARTWATALTLLACLAGACSRPPETAPEGAERAPEADTAALRSLPYASWVPVETSPEGDSISGVMRHDEDRSAPGWNLFAPRHLPAALLIDSEGEVVHRWATRQVSPGSWQHVELLPNGDLLTIVKDRVMARLAPDSSVKAVYRLRFHHDVDVATDGRLYAPARHERLVEVAGETILILDDFVTILSPTGEVETQLSLFEHFGDLVPKRRLDSIPKWLKKRGILEAWEERGGRDLVAAGELPPREVLIPPGSRADLFHLNSVEILRRDVPSLGPAGHLLISVRELNLIAVIDPQTGERGWTWGPGDLEAQHHPTVLDNGHVLVFDNGPKRGFSRVLEVDPASGEIVWQYRAAGEEAFFSHSRGANQRLPGGNTLITESDFGRVFEVTPDGDIVWEFFSPFLQENEGETTRSAIYRMTRLTASETQRMARLLGVEEVSDHVAP